MRNRRWSGWAGGIVIGLVGCIGEKAVAPSLTRADVAISTVTVSPLNTILAVGGAVQLNVAAQSLAGTPVTTFDSVLYVLPTITDTIRVQVGANGLITGRAPSNAGVPVLINIFPFKSGLTKGAQAIIQVTATTVSGATLSIQPVPPDTARITQNNFKTIVPVIRNPTTGQSVASPTIKYTFNPASVGVLNGFGARVTTATIGIPQSEQYEASIDNSVNRIFAVGTGVGAAWVYADVNVYGTMLHDSVQYTVTYPVTQNIGMGAINLGIVGNGNNATYYLAPGGTVTFSNAFSTTLGAVATFTLDNPAAATAAVPPSTTGGASGNVVGLAAGQNSKRRFLTPGTYTWTGIVSGAVYPFTGATASGRITVQ